MSVGADAVATGAGLSSAEAAARLVRAGANRLPVVAVEPAWRALGRQLVHFFAVLLWVASGLAFVAGMPELGVAIALVVLVNAVFAFAQEHRAERAAERLRDLLPRLATVLRDGAVVEVDAAELVPGDVVLLAAGDRVSADIELTEAHSLTIDRSTLTGESEAVPTAAGDRALAGTFVVGGDGRGVVEATGASTRMASIATLTQAGARPVSPLTLELRRVVRVIATVAIGLGSAFFLISLLVGTSATDAFLFAVGVTVALVPEGLLPTVTLSLAIGAQRMARRQALVRRLDAVETLGSTTLICTDKTGTLTQNQMAVVAVWLPGGEVAVAPTGYDPTTRLPAPAPLVELAATASACSDGHVTQRDGRWVAMGDPTEAALDVLARRVGASAGFDPNRAVDRRFPFDPVRRRMSVVVDGAVRVKGSVDAVLDRCRPVAGAAEAAHALAGRGLRVLAVAARPAPDLPDSADAAERDLTLLGLVGLEDPPRPEAEPAIRACRAAGIAVVMVTGDHPDTATAVAREVGLWRRGAPVLVGRDLPDDDTVLGALLDVDGAVVSRVSPEQKLRIAQALRARGHVVAMTGDGVNDGPALHAADIGIAMGRSGTDVAREAADLVLLDDSFATIVDAVRQGRSTFVDIQRFLTYHLTDNVAELTPFVVWALSGGRFPLAIGVLQVLCLDIGTDLLPALALGAERPAADAEEAPPRGEHLISRGVLARAFGVLGPVEALVEMAAFLTAYLLAGWRPGETFESGDLLLAASGAAFTAVVVGQMANAFACRSTTEPVWRVGWRGNRLLLFAVAVELLALGFFLLVPPVARELGHAVPGAGAAAVAFLAAPAVVLADAAHKRLRRRAEGPGPVGPVAGGRAAATG